jgi:hypothetical protein
MGGPVAKEERMRVITTNELRTRTDVEIAVLFHMAPQELGRTARFEPRMIALR